MSITEDFIQYGINVFKNLGLDNLSASIASILFIEPTELSLLELSEKTGYSLVSISNKMRFLEKLGIITRIKKPKSKRIFYFIDKSIIKVMERKMQKFM